MSSQGDALRRRFALEMTRERVDLALTIARNVAEAMPVDTGYALANTVISAGEPPSDPFGSPGDVSAADAGAAASLAEVMALTDPNAPINVSNAVRYLPRLNAGSSPQAAADFWERAVQDAIDEAQAGADTVTRQL